MVASKKTTQKFVFRLAERLQPIVIFIDEIEVLLGSRNNGWNSQYHNQLVVEFLTAMDGFSKSDSYVVVIGATNRLDDLDDAILRRLPLKVLIRELATL